VKVSYGQCLNLLPISPQGNSMLEIKKALDGLGIAPMAIRIRIPELSGLRVPAIVWTYPPKDAFVRSKDSRKVGHYIVVVPLGDGRIKVLDYPDAPVMIRVSTWAQHLQSLGIENTLAVLCGRKGQNPEQLLSSDQNAAANESNSDTGAFGASAALVIRADMPKDALAVWDFGDISEGAVVKHDFPLINGTDKELHVSKVSKDCVCSAAAADRKTLAPGTACTVAVTVSLAGRVGTQRISVALVFDKQDGIRPIVLLVTGRSHARWTVPSDIIDFGSIDLGSIAPHRDVPVHTSAYGVNSRISHAKCSSNLVTVDVVAKEEEGPGSYLLSLQVNPSGSPGAFGGDVEVFAAGQEKPAFSFPVAGEWYSNIAVQPTRLFLTPLSSPMGTLRLHHRGGQAIRLISTKVTDSALDALKVTASNEPLSDDLQIAVNLPTDKSGTYTGTLQLTLRIGNEQESHCVEVPFFCPGKVRGGERSGSTIGEQRR
jgi:hypothetical protein